MNVLFGNTPEAIAAADAEPWVGWRTHYMRPLTYESAVRLWLVGAGLNFMVATTGFLIEPLLPWMTKSQSTWYHAILVAALVSAALVMVQLIVASPRALRFQSAPSGLAFQLGSGLLITLAIANFGSDGDLFAVIYPLNTFAFYFMRPIPAGVVALCVPLEYGLLLLLQPGHPEPLLHWIMISLTYLGLGLAYGTIARRGEELHDEAEHARAELAAVNGGLQERVAEQVAELETANRFRRFLPPAVADVVATHQELALAPHRRKIAVFFCDLRGFTAFANATEPEDVMGVLDEYFEAVGGVLSKHGATIGAYTGDGLMAFFGDPLPTEAPALEAVEMASDLSVVMGAVVERWLRQGFALNHSAAISYGHATLGLVGAEGRSDYTALGSVVNLSARLCARAAPGQVLLDRATHLATHESRPSREMGTFDLKGFGPDIPAYELL